MALVEPPSCSHSSIHASRHPSWTAALRPPAPNHDRTEPQPRFDKVDLTSELDGLHIEGIDTLATFERIDTLGRALDGAQPSSPSPFPHISLHNRDDPAEERLHESKAEHRGPFQKWMRSLHRRAAQRPTVWGTTDGLPWKLLDPEDRDCAALSRKPGHRNSSSGSSFGFVSAVRSASVSLASVSAVTRSRRNTTRSHCHSRTDRSSRASMSGPRISEDSVSLERPKFVDAAAMERSLQRRRILEELINTEEGYIGDIRFLINVRCLNRIMDCAHHFQGLYHHTCVPADPARGATVVYQSESHRDCRASRRNTGRSPPSSPRCRVHTAGSIFRGAKRNKTCIPLYTWAPSLVKSRRCNRARQDSNLAAQRAWYAGRPSSGSRSCQGVQEKSTRVTRTVRRRTNFVR